MGFWDERYSGDDYAYGTEPNRWLVEQVERIAPGGRVLSLGEGEGRNAVWLAERGFSVDAVDGSPVGLEKARSLAMLRGVRIHTVVEDLSRYRPATSSYDALLLAFVHLLPALRRVVHSTGAAALKPGGVVILEAFTPRQLAFSSGGPKDPAALYEPDAIRSDFPGVRWDILEEVETELDEGAHHRGRAAVLRGFGRRVV